MHHFAFIISCLSPALVAGLPNALSYPEAAAPALDPNNPSGTDPTSPPLSVTLPSGIDDPFPNGIPTQPNGCDGHNPSSECFQALSSSGGYLYFDSDSQCSDSQKATFETAVWDATTLASYSSTFPKTDSGTRGQASGIFYMGPDFAQYATRIAGNLKRAWQFKTPASENVFITASCKDTQNICGPKQEGKGVGGYAWTYNGWLGYHHYITLCPPFFTLDTLATKIQDVEADLASGSTKMAKDMSWLKSTGQFFLHEMMHTRIADGDIEPYIIDEYVAPIPVGETRFTNDRRAYGA
jgi:hypothetical protein